MGEARDNADGDAEGVAVPDAWGARLRMGAWTGVGGQMGSTGRM